MKVTKNRTDMVVGLGIIAFVAFFWSISGRLSTAVRMMPRSALVVSLFTGVGILVLSFVRPAAQQASQTNPSRQLIVVKFLVLVTSTLLLVFVHRVGMYTALFLTMTSMTTGMTWVEHGWSKRRLVMITLYNLVITVVLYLLFSGVLGLNTPRGILI